jgi:hypothetical protein
LTRTTIKRSRGNQQIQANKESALTGPYDEQDFDQANELVKRRQRFFRRPKRPADLLGQLMARKGYAQSETANELESTWNEIVGTNWQTKTKVGSIRRGVLEIIVSNSSANQQLAFQKKKLLLELQKQLPKNNLKNLRFTIGSID